MSRSGPRPAGAPGSQGGDRTGEGGSSNATNNPPVYYAVEAVAYRLTSWTGLFNRIHAMRLVSALLGGLTVLLVFLFLRELLPRVPWAWSVGSLAVAFVPLFGEISGTVKEDNLAFAASRRAVALIGRVASGAASTAPAGLAIGAFAAVGALSRLAVFGLLPGVGVALAPDALPGHARSGAGRRSGARGRGRDGRRSPVLIYTLLNTGSGIAACSPAIPAAHSFGKPVASAAPRTPTRSPVSSSYIWQFYLPRSRGWTCTSRATSSATSGSSRSSGGSVTASTSCRPWCSRWRSALYVVILALAVRELLRPPGRLSAPASAS